MHGVSKYSKHAVSGVVALLIAVLGSSCATNDGVPDPVRAALARLPEIKPGTKEGHVFEILGLPKPNEESDSFIEGRTGSTWTRYEIGFGKRFVLECEAANFPAGMIRGGDLFSFDDGILSSVQIRHLRRANGNQGKYETLKEWKARQF